MNGVLVRRPDGDLPKTTGGPAGALQHRLVGLAQRIQKQVPHQSLTGAVEGQQTLFRIRHGLLEKLRRLLRVAVRRPFFEDLHFGRELLEVAHVRTEPAWWRRLAFLRRLGEPKVHHFFKRLRDRIGAYRVGTTRSREKLARSWSA